MKQHIVTHTKHIIGNRSLLISCLVLAVVALMGVIYMLISLHASDLKVVTHYSAFGLTHFYRDQWLYYVNFIVFVIAVAVFGIILSSKLAVKERPQLAVLYVWLSVIVICFMLINYTRLLEFL